MFRVSGDSLCYGDAVLGPRTALFVDSGELKGAVDGIVRLNTPHRIDMVFCAGERVVGVECKLPQDLLSSHASKRLARQMRVLLDVVDVACLGLRGLPGGGFTAWAQPLWNDLVRLQALGVVLLPLSSNDLYVPAQFAEYSEFLSGGRAPLAAVAGTDKARRVSRGPGWFLKMLKGVGPVAAAKLHGKFGSTRAALNATADEWRELKVSQKVIDRREEAMK